MRKLLSFAFMLTIGHAVFSQKALPPQYKNEKLPIEVRVADLLKRMTLEEKVAQLQCHWETIAWGTVVNEKNEADPAKLAKFAPHGLGQFARPNETQGFGSRTPFETATYANAIQKKKPAWAFLSYFMKNRFMAIKRKMQPIFPRIWHWVLLGMRAFWVKFTPPLLKR
jgi:hypothetical protein